MSRFILALLAFMLLCGCPIEPTFDMSSPAAYQKSIATIEARLSSAEQKRLQDALMWLAMSDLAEKNLFAALAGMTAMASPEAIVAKLAPKINGKTAAEVIRLADAESVARFERQIAGLDAQIADLGAELVQDEAKLKDGEAILAGIVIESPKYYWTKGGFSDTAVIDFKITNKSRTPIARIFVNGLLETPGRSIPWVKSSFNYAFKGGLEPGESQHLMLHQYMFGDWSDESLHRLQNTVLTLTLTNLEGANGEKLIAVNADEIHAKRHRLDSLKADRQKVQEQLETARASTKG